MGKLTPEQVQEIRHLYDTTDLGYKKLAERFGVKRETIRYYCSPRLREAQERARAKYEASAKGRQARRDKAAREKEGRRQLAIIDGKLPDEDVNPGLWARAGRMVGHRPQLTRWWCYQQLLRGCALTGIPFDHTDRHSLFYPQLDRIAPGAAGGEYTHGNCHVILQGLNRAKGANPQEDFLDFLYALRHP